MESNSRVHWYLAGICLGLVGLLFLLMTPQVSWAPPLIKMGVVNWEKVILEYKSFQTELKQLKRRKKEIRKYIDGELGSMSRGNGRSSGNFSKDMRSIYKDYMKQYQQRRRDTIQKHHNRIKRAIRKEAIEHGYSLILSESEVLYAADQYTNLTRAVIERLNQSSESQ